MKSTFYATLHPPPVSIKGRGHLWIVHHRCENKVILFFQISVKFFPVLSPEVRFLVVLIVYSMYNFCCSQKEFYSMGSPPVRTTFQPSLSLKCSDFRFSVATLLPVIVLSIIGWYCYLTSDHTFYDWHLIVFKQTQTQEPARSQTDGGQRSYMGRDTAGNRLSLSPCWPLRITTI